MKRRTYQPETKAVRGAADLDKKNGPLATPIYQTSTFEVTDNDEQLRATHTDHFYTRYGNPTNTVAERTISHNVPAYHKKHHAYQEMAAWEAIRHSREFAACSRNSAVVPLALVGRCLPNSRR